MRPPSNLQTLPGRWEIDADDFADNATWPELNVRAREAEIYALQMLVCHLLEKNERLRMRIRAKENTTRSSDSIQ